MAWNLVSEVSAGSRKYRILRALKTGALDQRSISRLAMTERSNTGKTLRHLRALGLVECLTPNRPRAKMFRITPLGKTVLEKARR